MPEEPSLILLAISLIFLLILSAFFSGSETGMMASNKIKLRNKVKKGSNSSKRALELLSRPDNLLSVILVGNNFANILASAIVTIIMINFFEGRVLLGSVLLTIIILIFSEITPKTTASAYPEEFASKSSWLLDKFSRILNPFIYIINQFSSRILNLLKVDIKKSKESDNLNVDELKTLLEDKNTQISSDFKSMLSSILDMDQLTVEDMMVPLSEIVGINTKDSIDEIKQIIEKSSYSMLPVYEDNLENCFGMLDIKNAHNFIDILEEDFSSSPDFEKCLQEVYFAAVTTSLTQQLREFQNDDENLALVVDEYGEIEGLISVEDIFLEIAGKFSHDIDELNKEFEIQNDGSVISDGNSKIRDLNNFMSWNLPEEDSKTLNGLISSEIDDIPSSKLCIEISNYQFEIMQIDNNSISKLKIKKV